MVCRQNHVVKKNSRSTWRYVIRKGDGSAPPWCLTLARECLDYQGNWMHLPRDGGALNQNEYEMDAIKNAWAIDRLFGAERNKDSEFKKTNGRFRYWVLSKDDDREVWLNPALEYED